MRIGILGPLEVRDEAGQLVLALQRAGHITSAEANHLHAEYLRAKYE